MKKHDKKIMQSQVITDSVLNFLNYMPNPDDVAGGSFNSYETYRKMKTDSRISSLLGLIKNGALNFPLHIVQGDSEDKVYEFIKSISLFDNLQKKTKRMLTGLDYGFCVSELIWKIEGNSYIPENFIARKPERFHFNSNWELFLNELGSNKKLDDNYKWLIYQHDPDDENPYGSSVLRCVYWAWCFKEAGYDFWLQATEKFSVKSLVALFEADGDESAIQERANGIAEMLMGITSGSTAAVGNIREIKDVGMQGDLSHFKELVEACDTQICYGLTGQSIATSATSGGSLALGEVQAGFVFEQCKSIALEIQSVLQKIIDWTVELNFGEGVEAPLFQFDVEKRASFEQIMAAIDRGVPVSKSSLYSYYGLPEPTDEDDSFVKESGNQFALSDSDLPRNELKKNFQFF